MRLGLAPVRGVRRLPLLLTLTLAPLACLAGCDSINNPAYPEAMRYPLRDDLLVLNPPKNTILYPFAEPPGRLEETIAKIPSIEGGEGKVANPKDMKPADRKDLQTRLDKIFGTPAKPTLNPIDDEDLKATADALLLDDKTLATGSKLYRRHCLQCHGVAGDGRGPTGPWVQPHPRDYRQGLFKFVSSDPGNPKLGKARKPRREDLHRTLVVGIEGTSMPSFAVLSEDELKAIISYVIHLSIRGEVEYAVTTDALGQGVDDIPAAADDALKLILDRWKISQTASLVPRQPDPPANKAERELSVQRGFEAFTDSKVGNCVSCHFDFGRQAQFRYDAWGSLVRPNNLTGGIYRGGRRPIDLYYRVAAGINPCDMPAVRKEPGDLGGDETKTRENEKLLWDLVNFVQALPYREMLPKDVQEKVYPERHAEKLAER